MKQTLLALLFVFLLAGSALAVDTTELPRTVEDPIVPAEDVPMPGSWADWWMQNVTERLQVLIAQTEERKVEREEKFAARREAHLQRLENVEDEELKAKLTEKLEERYRKHLERIQERADKLTEKKTEILERIQERKESFETVREFVTERKEERTQNREEFLKKLEELRSKRRSLVDEFKDDVKDGSGSAKDAARELKTGMQEVNTEVKDAVRTKKVENLELRNKYKERMTEDKKRLEEEREESAKPAEVKFAERVKEEVSETKTVETDGSVMTTNEANQVLGASDYQPVGFFEKIGWWLAGN